MAARLTIHPPGLHDAQREVARDPARHKILICGRRWGKTLLGVVLGLFGSPSGHKGALQGAKVWWVAPTYSASRIAYDMTARLARKLPPGYAEIRLGDLEVRTATGGSFAFKSGDNADNLRGASLDGLIMDEADFQREETFRDVLYPMLVDRGGWSLLVSTPHIEGGWLHNMYLRAEAGEIPGTKVFTYPSATNPHLPPEEVERARIELGEIAFAREFEARWISAEGALVKREWVKTGIHDVSRISVGVDLAISRKTSADFTAFVAVGKCEAGYVVMAAERHRAGFHQIIQRLVAFCERWQPSIVAIESVAFQQALSDELLRTTSLPVTPVRAVGDKITRFTPVAAKYEAGLIWHSPTLPSEFTEEILSFPLGAHDDFADALAYALQQVAVGYDWLAKV